jgi:hypothetical protein
MTEHMRSIRQALLNFVEDHEDEPGAGVSIPMGNEPARFVVTPSGLSEDIHAVVYIPAFDAMGYGARQRMVWDYLKQTLPLEELKHLSLLRTASSAEWDELAGLPPLEGLTVAGVGS